MVYGRHRGSRHSALPFAAAILVGLAATPACARTLSVGPGHALQVPSQAALLARAGDRIEIAPGTYADCAVWQAPRLTIVAPAGDATITGPSCNDKGLFVILGSGVSISGLTFRGARNSEHTGAGLRIFGDDVSVSHSRFLDNENGILAGGSPNSVLRVSDSEFRGNGSCAGACAHGVYAGRPIAALLVERCRFSDTHVGHHVKSRARTTAVVGTRIEDGADGTASYLIDVPNGGNVLIQDNVLHKGVRSQNASTAITLGEEGVTNRTDAVIVRDNVFTSDLTGAVLFVRNQTTTPATLAANRLRGMVTPLDGPGTVEP